MEAPDPGLRDGITQHESADISMKAGNVFQPRAPISAREFFAGRWEQLTTVNDAVAQTGLHIVIFGERGVGKTSLANVISPLLEVMEEDQTKKPAEPRLVVKVNTNQDDSFAILWARILDEVFWDENRPVIGFGRETVKERTRLRDVFGISSAPSIDEVRRLLSELKRSVFIFDEFDRGSPEVRRSFTDLIKALSDYGVDSTIVVVGVSDTVDNLVKDHASIVRALVQVQLPRMTERELGDILEKAGKTLGVYFTNEAASLIVRMSQGLPHYTHLIGLHATREAAKRLSRRIQCQDVHNSFSKAVQQAIQSIRDKHAQATHSAHKDALYSPVILGCACASCVAGDPLGYFHLSDVVGPLTEILKREDVPIAAFQRHIHEFCEERGPVLERSGSPRTYRYRFRDPLLPPYIFMTAMSTGLVTAAQLNQLTRAI